MGLKNCKKSGRIKSVKKSGKSWTKYCKRSGWILVLNFWKSGIKIVKKTKKGLDKRLARVWLFTTSKRDLQFYSVLFEYLVKYTAL